jgi:hypothetical protein
VKTIIGYTEVRKNLVLGNCRDRMYMWGSSSVVN